MAQTEGQKQEMKQQAAANQRHPLVGACGRFLVATVENNVTMNRQPHESLSSFEDFDPSTIRADVYVKRIMKYGGCSPSVLALGLLYVERLKHKLLQVWITPQNIQRLFLVAVLEAAKHWDDFYYSNEHWAKIGGVTLKELNMLELEFLNLMDWKLYVSADEYAAFSDSILEWQLLPKTTAPQVKVETKGDESMRNVPRCLWDSCKSRAQVLASKLAALPAISPSPKAGQRSPPSSGTLSSSSSSSALSEATTPRHLDSPQNFEQQADKDTVQIWGQGFNVA